MDDRIRRRILRSNVTRLVHFVAFFLFAAIVMPDLAVSRQASGTQARKTQTNTTASNPTPRDQAKEGLFELPAEQNFHQQMKDLAKRCDELNRPDLAEATRDWIRPRDPGRRYLFLAGQQYHDLLPLVENDATAEFWSKRVRDYRQEFANELLAAAKETSGEETTQAVITAMQYLHRAAFEFPEHSVVMKILGRKQKDGQWIDSSVGRIGSVRKGRRPERNLNWNAGDYSEINSANFRLLTTADAQQATAMLARMEVWRSLWRQIAVPYWSNPQVIRACLDSQRPIPESNERKHEMVLFANREEFLRGLSHISGIEKSVGYYDGQSARAFFYLDPDDPSLETTWLHELTHQLFSETGSRSKQPGEKSNTWLAEGIAIYFESLKPLSHNQKIDWQTAFDADPAETVGGLWSIGGFEASRLQNARIRWFREGYFVPFAELTQRGRLDFQADPEIARTYSQAGAMSQFLMSSNNNYQSAVWELLSLMYANRDRADSLETLTSATSQQLEQQFKAWLSFDIQSAPWITLAEHNQELALGYSEIKSDDVMKLQTDNLVLLQLSSSKIDDELAQWIGKHSNIQQLFLDKNQISDTLAVAAIKANPRLQALDLAGTAITNQTIAALKDNHVIERLWLTSTGISDECVEDLLSMRNLEKLDVRGCKLSAESIERLSASFKGLEK